MAGKGPKAGLSANADFGKCLSKQSSKRQMKRAKQENCPPARKAKWLKASSPVMSFTVFKPFSE